jgi:hypothetical protein
LKKGQTILSLPTYSLNNWAISMLS